MKKIVICLMASLFINGSVSNASELLPLTSDFAGKNWDEPGDFPRNFRTTDDPIQAGETALPSLAGLSDLNIAGTGQFTETQLLNILNYLGGRVLVIDLREETHLLFRDVADTEIPLTAYHSMNEGNKGKSMNEITQQLQRYKDHINSQSFITLYHTENREVLLDGETPQYQVGEAQTEKEVVEKISELYFPGVEYAHFPVTDHLSPSIEWIDAFLILDRVLAERNEATTILFHCRAGRGRTGMFMVMKDMIMNAASYSVSFEDILERQKLLGSPDFSRSSVGKGENYLERYNLLRHFYEYVLASDGLEEKTLFSEWVTMHPFTDYYHNNSLQQN